MQKQKRSFVEVSDVVRIANAEGEVLSVDTVRRAERRGELVALRTPRGARLFDEIDVRRWLARRREARAERTGDAA